MGSDVCFLKSPSEKNPCHVLIPLRAYRIAQLHLFGKTIYTIQVYFGAVLFRALVEMALNRVDCHLSRCAPVCIQLRIIIITRTTRVYFSIGVEEESYVSAKKVDR